MGTLAAALAWAKRGFSVFPLAENSKEPIQDEWPDTATNDLETIKRLWTDPVLRIEQNFNIGVRCNELVVVDVDVKKGKDGYNEYLQMGGTFDTLVTRTPSGGFHCYFLGPDSSNAPLSGGVDIRSHNGYVVAPGSVIDGILYELINDKEMSWVPPLIERVLRPPYVRADPSASTVVDDPAAIQAAINFLKTCPVAVEGQRGDETTFTTAARLVREMALSVASAFYLMRDYWNPRCRPPWELPDLLTKVENAAAYGSAEHGRLAPAELFRDLNIPDAPDFFAVAGSDFGNGVLPSWIAPRPWLMDKALMHGAVTLLLAAGSAGKSSISLAIAAHLALGLPFGPYPARKACKTIIYNGEDDVIEQSRRLLAMCMAYGFDYNVVKKEVMLISSREIKLDLVSKEYHKPIRNDALVNHIIKVASREDVGLLILDPLVNVHKCDESDNVQMNFVMDVLTDIARYANVSVLALHHTSKTNSRQEDRIGNMDIARGASAVVNAARIAFTLLNASNQDCEDYGFGSDERHMWVRMDDAKMNMSLADGNATWFRKDGIRIPSNDLVGVLRYMTPQRSHDHIKVRIGLVLIEFMETNGTGSMSMSQATSILRIQEPLWAGKTDPQIRKMLEGHFAFETEIRGRKLRVMRDADDNVALTLT